MRMERQLLEAMALHILELEVEDCHRLLAVEVNFHTELEVVAGTPMVVVEDSGEQVEEAVNCSGLVGAGRVEVVSCR